MNISEKKHKSIYDIDLNSWDGSENFLAQYRGKVSLVINVTADCGNAPQYGVIERIYEKYKDQGFEVIAIPTNDFCGNGITYKEWEDGISCAQDARDYGVRTYGVTYNFSELIKSDMSEEWRIKKDRLDQVPHELYQEISKVSVVTGGNFEKYLFDKEGYFIQHFPNAALLDFAYDHAEKLGVESNVGTAEQEFERICLAIESALAN